MAKSESTKIEFGYFHDYESEQFAFYRIPKVLFTDEYFRNLSSDAKVLYGLMLDRMALSIRHQWFDEEGKVYIIFTVEQVIQYMNCGRDKAMKTLAELDCYYNTANIIYFAFSQRVQHRKTLLQSL